MNNLMKYIKKVTYHKFAKILHRLSQPKCPNDYKCPECIHHQYVFDGIEFKGIYCNINAK